MATTKIAQVRVGEARRFIIDCLKTLGANCRQAKQQAELLIYADKMGIQKHGLQKLDSYVYAIESGVCEPNNDPEILKEELSTARVDPKNVMGATTGHFAMSLAINKAYNTGVGWVTVKGLNLSAEPYSYWTEKAAVHNLIGLAFSTTSPAVPAPYITNKSEIMGDLLPSGEALAHDRRFGMPDVALSFKLTRPYKSRRNKPRYRKHGIAVMAGLLSGPSSATLDPTNSEDGLTSSAENIVMSHDHCFVAINPVCFATGFDRRFTKFNQHWGELDPTDLSLLEMTLPTLNDVISRMAYESGDEGILSYELEQVNSSIALARKLKVQHMNLG